VIHEASSLQIENFLSDVQWTSGFVTGAKYTKILKRETWSCRRAVVWTVAFPSATTGVHWAT